MGWGVWLGGTAWGDCGRKVSTQRKYACVFAGSDVRGKCKRITLTLSSISMHVCRSISCMGVGRESRGRFRVNSYPNQLELVWVRVGLGTSWPGYKLVWVRVGLGTSWPGYGLVWVRVGLGTSWSGYGLVWVRVGLGMGWFG